MAKTSIRDLVHINVRGVVQGVGFRPFIYQLATKYNLKGWVCNTSEDVKIEVEGEAGAIEQFLLALQEQAPPRASIEAVTTTHPQMSLMEADLVVDTLEVVTVNDLERLLSS